MVYCLYLVHDITQWIFFFFNLRKKCWCVSDTWLRVEYTQMFAELESSSLILNPLGRCYLKASHLIKYRQLTLGHHLRDGDGGDGKFHQSCYDKHLRLSHGESRLAGQDLSSHLFPGCYQIYGGRELCLLSSCAQR